MATKSIQNAYLILELDTRERLNFQFMPEHISDGGSAVWHSEPVLGRSEPYLSYEGSSSRQWGFDLKFVASMDAGDGGLPEDVVRKVNWLRALRYPEVADKLVLGPPVCWFVVGYNWIASRVVAQDVRVTYSSPWFGQSNDAVDNRSVLYPMSATVSLTFLEVNLVPRAASIVRAGLERVSPDVSVGQLAPGL